MQNTARESNPGAQAKECKDDNNCIAQQLTAIEEIRTHREIEDITIKVRVWRLLEHIA